MKRLTLILAAMSFSVSVAMAAETLDSHGGVLDGYISYNSSQAAQELSKDKRSGKSSGEVSNSIDNEITAGDSKNSLLDTNPDTNF